MSRRPREHNLAASCHSGSDGSGFPAGWAGLLRRLVLAARLTLGLAAAHREAMCVYLGHKMPGIAELCSRVAAAAGAAHLYTLRGARVSHHGASDFPNMLFAFFSLLSIAQCGRTFSIRTILEPRRGRVPITRRVDDAAPKVNAPSRAPAPAGPLRYRTRAQSVNTEYEPDKTSTDR